MGSVLIFAAQPFGVQSHTPPKCLFRSVQTRGASFHPVDRGNLTCSKRSFTVSIRQSEQWGSQRHRSYTASSAPSWNSDAQPPHAPCSLPPSPHPSRFQEQDLGVNLLPLFLYLPLLIYQQSCHLPPQHIPNPSISLVFTSTSKSGNHHFSRGDAEGPQ